MSPGKEVRPKSTGLSISLKFAFSIFFLLMLLLKACGGSGTNNPSSDLGSGYQLAEINVLEFRNGSADATLNENGLNFLIAYPDPATVSMTSSQLNLASNAEYLSNKLSQLNENSLLEAQETQYQEILHAYFQTLNALESSEEAPTSKYAQTLNCSETSYSVFADRSKKNMKEICATERFNTSHVRVYVEEGYPMPEGIQSIAQNFENYYDNLTTLLEADPGLIELVFTPSVNSLGSNSIIAGYFLRSQPQAIFLSLPDNEGQYGPSYPQERFIQGVPDSIEHEFIHLLVAAARSPEGLPSFSTPLNEALAVLLEGFNPQTGKVDQLGAEVPSLFAQYLDDTQNGFRDSTMVSRGGFFAWLSFLYQRAEQGRLEHVTDGTDFLKQLVHSEYSDWELLKNLAGGEEILAETFKDFALSLLLDGLVVDGSTNYEFANFSPRDSFSDYHQTHTDGPFLESLSQSLERILPPSGINFVLLEGPEIHLKAQEGMTAIQVRVY